MNTTKYIIGFIFGILFVYLFCSAVSWDLDPGKWSATWRLLGVLFLPIWGHIIGSALRDHEFIKISLDKH